VSRSDPRERLLATATRLFDAEGIRAIGVERLVAETPVTRATFYRHFPTKDDLVVAYLRATDSHVRASVAERTRGLAGRDAILAIFEWLASAMRRRDFRGCTFTNAAAEYPRVDHPVRVAVRAYRDWFRDTLRTHLIEAGHPDPDRGAVTLVMLRDGAMTGCFLDEPATVSGRLTAAARAELECPQG